MALAGEEGLNHEYMGSTGAPPAAWQGPEGSREISQQPIQQTASHTEFRTPPVEKARIVYLCHHLGPGDAVKFIENTIDETQAKRLLSRQVGETVAEKKYVKTNGDSWVKGHRAWLTSFVRAHILLSEFTCPGGQQKKSVLAEKDAVLTTVTDKLRGSNK